MIWLLECFFKNHFTPLWARYQRGKSRAFNLFLIKTKVFNTWNIQLSEQKPSNSQPKSKPNQQNQIKVFSPYHFHMGRKSLCLLFFWRINRKFMIFPFCNISVNFHEGFFSSNFQLGWLCIDYTPHILQVCSVGQYIMCIIDFYFGHIFILHCLHDILTMICMWCLAVPVANKMNL